MAASTLRRPSCSAKRTSRASKAVKDRRGRMVGEAKVRMAKSKGVAIINHGAGTMPVGAPAPFGGTRYTILADSPWTKPLPRVAAHRGQRNKDGKLYYPDAPDFEPLLTPAECIRAGIFGGCYFNPRGGKPGIFGPVVDIDVKEFPRAWFSGIPEALYTSRRYHVPTNKFGVKAGQDQAFWESKGWIHEQDPRGWFQWYCRFFQGRRTEDDERQIKRWKACAGPKGRWRNQLCSRVLNAKKKFDDPTVSPVIRQTLLHWAYELTEGDWIAWNAR